MERYYQPEIETMPQEELRKLQSERLVAQVKHVYNDLPYYRNLMDEKGEMALAVSDMEICKKITPTYLAGNQQMLSNARVIVADTNIPAETLVYLAENSTAPVLPESERVFLFMCADADRSIKLSSSGYIEIEKLVCMAV